MSLALAVMLTAPAYAQEAPSVEEPAQEASVAPPGETDATQDHEHAADANVAESLDSDGTAPPETVADQESTVDPTVVEAEGTTAQDEAGETSLSTSPVATIAIPSPPAGMGHVVFFREKKFAGGGVRFKVREAGEELGKLGSGSYFVHVATPGVHEYVVHSESEDVLTLEVEDGETYFVQGSISLGVLVGRPNLSPSDETVFAAMSDKLKPAKK